VAQTNASLFQVNTNMLIIYFVECCVYSPLYSSARQIQKNVNILSIPQIFIDVTKPIRIIIFVKGRVHCFSTDSDYHFC